MASILYSYTLDVHTINDLCLLIMEMWLFLCWLKDVVNGLHDWYYALSDCQIVSVFVAIMVSIFSWVSLQLCIARMLAWSSKGVRVLLKTIKLSSGSMTAVVSTIVLLFVVWCSNTPICTRVDKKMIMVYIVHSMHYAHTNAHTTQKCTHAHTYIHAHSWVWILKLSGNFWNFILFMSSYWCFFGLFSCSSRRGLVIQWLLTVDFLTAVNSYCYQTLVTFLW